MSKISNNTILSKVVFGLLILLILAVGAIAFIPFETRAASGYYGGTGTPAYDNNSYGNNEFFYSDPGNEDIAYNPEPRISYVDPNSATSRNANMQVTVSGSGFIPSSRARFDNLSRATVYGSSTKLYVTLTPADLSVPGTHVITVSNPTPGGGTSNGVYFTVERNSNGAVLGATTYPRAGTRTVYVNSPSSTTPVYNSYEDNAEEFADLTANAINGNGSFLPSGLIGWVMLAIIILIIVILVRKFLGLESNYHSTPLKHS